MQGFVATGPQPHPRIHLLWFSLSLQNQIHLEIPPLTGSVCSLIPQMFLAGPLPTWVGQAFLRMHVASVVRWSALRELGLSPAHAQDGKAVLSTHRPDHSLHPPPVSSSKLPFQGQGEQRRTEDGEGLPCVLQHRQGQQPGLMEKTRLCPSEEGFTSDLLVPWTTQRTSHSCLHRMTRASLPVPRLLGCQKRMPL